MSMMFNKKSGKSGKNGGFYIAIALCCAAVCLVAWSTALSKGGSKEVDTGAVEQQSIGDLTEWPVDESADGYDSYYEPDVDAAATTAPAATTTTTAPTFAEAPDATPAAATTTTAAAPAPMIFKMPVSGSAIKPFSGTDLVYCETMCDWRVHQGVDIACPQGSQITACCDGTVAEVLEDMLYGNTVIVRHADESMMYYCGLSSVPAVTKGQQVSVGDVVGTLEQVPCESAAEPHLHLAMVKEGVFVDPLSAMGLS